MRTVIVPSESLGYLLLLEPELEPEPEVFRLQPEISFVITFERYLDFLHHYLGKSDYLSTPSEMLHILLHKYRRDQNTEAKRELFSAFLKDVACAASKELYFAESFGKGGSAIIHSVDEGTSLLPEDVDNLFLGVWELASLAITKRMSSKGYLLPRRISAVNAHLWKYAIVTYYLSDVKMFWSYNNK